ncbi:ABC transporter permease [Bacillus carboniphilus]|uniref:Transport permease protein n=1 Tax=Bacillus carboniphilus TaxID=86663 RepID=A0ABY9JQW5_9BACI|nr:ABC transporter permease [Bacillus carboniphilus]WLR41796.1 ABC transporter permease [Bacillus carboniphilus]
MISVIFRSMITTSLRDKISLGYSLIFPFVLLIGLGLYFDEGAMPVNIVAGVTAISTTIWGMQGIAFQIHFQRNRGVYKLLNLTPFTTFSFVTIMTLARTFLGVMINMVIWLAGMLFFQLELSLEMIFSPLLLTMLACLCFSSIGFFIANLANNEGQINMYCNLIQLPMILMSEAFYSLNSAPDWVVVLGKILPFEYYVKALKGMLTSEYDSMIMAIISLGSYFIIMTLLAVKTFKWEQKSLVKKKGKPSLYS